ncbi:MAG: hypothetical protein ACKOUK_00275 [Verrucomicrobiota bacterium]
MKVQANSSQLQAALNNPTSSIPGQAYKASLSLETLNLRNVYLSSKGDIHVSNNGWSRMWAGLLGRKTGEAALRGVMSERLNFSREAIDRAMTKITGFKAGQSTTTLEEVIHQAKKPQAEATGAQPSKNPVDLIRDAHPSEPPAAGANEAPKFDDLLAEVRRHSLNDQAQQAKAAYKAARQLEAQTNTSSVDKRIKDEVRPVLAKRDDIPLNFEKPGGGLSYLAGGKLYKVPEFGFRNTGGGWNAVNQHNQEVGARLGENCDKFRAFVSEHKEVMKALVAKNAFGDRTTPRIRKAVDDAFNSSPAQAQFGVEDFRKLQEGFFGNIEYTEDGAVPWTVLQGLERHQATLSKQLDGAS